MEEILIVILLVYTILLTIDEIVYLKRGYRVVKYTPKRKTEVILSRRKK